MRSFDTDVLIAGAGPTGLMLANQLARRGIRIELIDRHSGPAQQTRAIGVQARTLEIYDRLGIMPQALALGFRTAGANLWAEGVRKARIPLGDIGNGMSPFPFVFMLGQDDNERILGAKLREFGHAPQWSTELATFEQRADHVAATIRQPDGSARTVTASWLAGCDGARSTVREQCGIGFPGAPYEHVFFVADTVATGPMAPNELNVYLWREGFHLFFPMHGTRRWRVIGILPTELRGRDDLGFEAVIADVRSAVGADLAFERCLWYSTYRIHHRCAERFRAGRCFLMGDAAHIHSPAGAQGMNTGLQDAYNLAWKLALVIDGRADPTLLDTYEAERLPNAQRLLHTTDRAFKVLVADAWYARLLRTRIVGNVAAFAMRRDTVRRFVFRTVSQIGIRYPDSPLSRGGDDLPDGAPRPGDRFPWLQVRFREGGEAESLFAQFDDTRFTLLVVGQAVDAALEHPQLLQILVIPMDHDNSAALAKARVPAPSWFLLRPDGHIACCGVRLEFAVLEAWFEAAGIRGK